MRILSFCMMALLLTACHTRRPATPAELTMLVGTYTSGESRGIYSFRFNQETGASAPLATTDVSNPSYLTVSADKRFVYAVSEESDTTSALNAFALDAATGKLRLLNRRPTYSAAPCYVSTNGREVLTANYGGGTMAVFPLNADGSIGPVDTLFEGSTGGTDSVRQATPHIHCALYSPDGKYIFATDFSADRILRFAVHPKNCVPFRSEETFSVAPGSGPRHLTFSADGAFAYLISELSGNVTAFRYHDGQLETIQTIAADTLRARASADIHLSGDGRYLYASNRRQGDGIAVFAVDAATGQLSAVGYQPTALHPRNFALTPNGRFLLVACRDSGCIQVFARDADTGLLRDTHQDIRLDKPVCIRFV